MRERSLRRQFLLSTTMLVGAITGYGGRAYGGCVFVGGSTYECSGAETTQQTITFDDATVVTLASPAFSVVTTDPRAVSISGDGAISYTDVYYSTLTSTNVAGTALYIRSDGDVYGGNPGSVTVNTNGTLTGGRFGIQARNYGSGALSVTADGDVTGTSIVGIEARNSIYGTDLSVTTGAGTSVTGADGVFARNNGAGTLTVTAYGDVTGTSFFGRGIYARNSGIDLDVTTGAGTTVTGGFTGIYARNDGSGALTITANGDVTGTGNIGIYARNSSAGTDLDVTTGAGTNVTGANYGIRARNYGSGALTVTANGDVEGTSNTGIYARNFAAGTDLGVTTGAGTMVTGSNIGIFARNSGSGALTVTANGDVEGTSNTGIYARNFAAGTDLGVTTGAGTTVTGGLFGIYALNQGSGALDVTANGDVTGTSDRGIHARNYGTDLDVTTGAGTTVTGGNLGIYAGNFGSGALSVTANGDVTGTNAIGIYARNINGTDLGVTTGADSTVTGGDAGIIARNYGSGAVSITANGDVTGTGNIGIYARNSSNGTDLDVTTGAGSTVTGGNYGIRVFNFGSGALTVTANGDVEGTNIDGIRAYNSGNGTDLDVTTGAGTEVTGGAIGIRARNYGTGALTVTADGDVEGTNNSGIDARNFNGTGLDVTTGADTNVTGGDYGIRAINYGSGALTVTADGDANGTTSSGIYARNSAAGTDLDVTTGAGTTVTGGSRGIFARNYGSGALSVTANGDVTGTNYAGINARNSSNGTNLDVTTGPSTNGVTGGTFGILALNYGSGALSVTADGDANGTTSSGIYAKNSAAGTDLDVTTGAGTEVTGGALGIRAFNYGSGALSVTANGDVTGTADTGILAQNFNGTYLDVTTGANTTVEGGAFGIRAINSGSGALTVTADGNVTGTAANSIGLYARNNNGTYLDVTTGAGTAVTGGNYGIVANNFGSGALTVTANGDVEGTNLTGIFAYNSGNGTDLDVTTGASTYGVTGANYGIRARNYGSGALTVTANGDVEGTSFYGIFARNSSSGTALDVTTGADTEVTGGLYGIRARNYGSGALTVTANGDVEGTNLTGIYARNDGTALDVTTGADTTVTGGTFGIYARNLGSGALSVTANGDVEGTSNSGIYAGNSAAGTDVEVTTGANTTVTGGLYGIRARNDGTGALTVTANGDVTGTNYTGILARNTTAATGVLTVTTGANTTVMGRYGIVARNYGSEALTVTANGDVEGTSADGIFARNNNGTDLSVTTGASTTVTGGANGIFARNYGSGDLTVTADGDVEGTTGHGIYARNNNGTALDVTTGADTEVTGGTYGIRARNYGSGALTVTADGDVTGTAGSSTGIYARNNNGTALDVTTGAGTEVTGGNYGIFANNFGSGALTVTADGSVEGTNLTGIFAQNNNGTYLDVTTGADTEVTGGNYGIFARNFGSGALTVTANGDVTGTNVDGIYARRGAGGGSIDITVGSASAVTSNGTGFAIRTYGGPSDVTVAGTLNGGTGGAAQFDQVSAFNDRFALETTAVINGNAFGGLGTDTLALQGTGIGSFDAGQLVDFESGEKTGTSIWTLTGTNTQIADFAVNDGVLFVNGSLANAAFTVNAGTLGGTGTIGAVTVLADAVFAPGNSIGTITANGNLLFNAGAIYEVEVNAAGLGDQTIVIGTVNLTGSVLRVLAEDGTYDPSTDYIIVDNDGADAVTGTFGTVTSNLAFLTPTVAYDGGDGNDVVLTLERNAVDFCAVAQTPNQCNVALALDQFPTDNPLFLAVLNQTAAGARQAFDALSGEIHATIPGVLADDSRYLREAVLGRLAQAAYTAPNGQVAALGLSGPQVASLDARAMALGPDDKSLAAPPAYGPGLAFWAQGYGAWGDFGGNANAATAERDLGGIVSGLDARIGGTWRLGFATGYSKSDVSVAARHSSADVESFHLAGYSGGMAGPVALRGGGAWSWNEVDTSRAVIFPGFFEREQAGYDADTGQIFGEAAYPIVMGRSAVEPFAGLAYVSIDSGTVKENGALAGLRGSGDDLDVGYSTLGLRAAATMAWNSVTVTPHVSAAWQHAFDDVTTGAALAFASTGIGFTVTGVPLAEDTALIEAGLDLGFGPNTTLGVSYSGQFGDNVEDNAVEGRFAWRF